MAFDGIPFIIDFLPPLSMYKSSCFPEGVLRLKHACFAKRITEHMESFKACYDGDKGR